MQLTFVVMLNFLCEAKSQTLHCACALMFLEHRNSIAGDTVTDGRVAVCVNVKRVVDCRFVFVSSFGFVSALAMSSTRA